MPAAFFGRNPFRLRQASEPDTAPTGSIVMWSGTNGNIPAGWALCDGSNGTPDLRDRFVAGIGSTYTAGAFGSETKDVSHTHTVGSQTLATSTTTTGWTYSSTGTTSTYRTSNSHSHTLSSGSTTSQSGTTLTTVPAYWALAYIQKQ